MTNSANQKIKKKREKLNCQHSVYRRILVVAPCLSSILCKVDNFFLFFTYTLFLSDYGVWRNHYKIFSLALRQEDYALLGETYSLIQPEQWIIQTHCLILGGGIFVPYSYQLFCLPKDNSYWHLILVKWGIVALQNTWLFQLVHFLLEKIKNSFPGHTKLRRQQHFSCRHNFYAVFETETRFKYRANSYLRKIKGTMPWK